MFKYNNTHIFTGYLKQFLSSFNLPACKVYTHEFAKYLEQHGTEDPRVLQSFDNHSDERLAVRINYLKNDEVYNYFWKYLAEEPDLGLSKSSWRRSANLYYSNDKRVIGLTRNLNSPGIIYDTKTHEYLGDYLRFLRDYHNINLMSLYNCFTDKIYNNVYFNFLLHPSKPAVVNFNAQDSEYRLYAIPVKLFSEYTIAIDCDRGIELFCGLYNTNLDMSGRALDLARRTYQKVNKTLFNQPFLYEKLNLSHWPVENDFIMTGNNKKIRTSVFTRWDITNREKDLKLFIKVPVSCRSSITILEGDFRAFNNAKYAPVNNTLLYQSNHSVLNFNTKKVTAINNNGDGIDLNNYNFKPISKLQLLAFNTGESYPFADRLIEYLGGSVITPIDEISDNIKRVQRVMKQNNNYFKIEGLWESKMQNIIYDYMINSGPIEIDKSTGKLTDKRQGLHQRLGHTSKSLLYDVLGYVDRDTEKWYASWKKENGVARVDTSLQTVDIYNGIYDIG
jgi:hypothetical protein